MLPRMKHFATTQVAEQAAPVDFSVDFVRELEEDGVTKKIVETHEFTARPAMAYGDVLGLAANEESPRALQFLDRIIRRALLNDDGTPEKWTPYVHDDHFNDPVDGHRTHVDDLPAFESFESGSSRRRWARLINAEDVFVEMRQVTEVLEFLSEEAAGRPTSRSARSSR